MKLVKHYAIECSFIYMRVFVFQAAHLALSILPHSHLLGATESSRAIQQCREQSPKMLEQACMAVEKVRSLSLTINCSIRCKGIRE